MVVDPVPGERARPDELMVRRAVGVDRQRKRRPRSRRVDPKKRLPSHPPRRGDPGAPAYGLDEANRVALHLRIGPQDVEGDAGHDHVLRTDAESRRTDETVALVAPARG